MKIGFLAPPSEFANAIFECVKAKLRDDLLVRWRPEMEPGAPEIEVLLSLGPVTREMMEQMPGLALIQILSDGYEAVDIDSATELGIRVSYSPGEITGNADSVAEYAILLMLATARQLSRALAAVREPSIVKPGRGRTLVGAQACIVGLGSIGQKIASRLLAFGVQLNAVDLVPARAPKEIATCSPDQLCQAVAQADFVILSVRASSENTHMIDARVMAAMKKGAILINIARGSLVDEQALYEAIRSGHLGGAGLDVEEHEPVSPNDPLLTLPEVFLTPHEAGLTELNIQGTSDHVADVLAKYKAELPIDSQLNRPGPGRAS